MDFAQRFKGRTNHLTRDGIISTLTDKSIPIEKEKIPFKPGPPTNVKKKLHQNLNPNHLETGKSPKKPSKIGEISNQLAYTDRRSLEKIKAISEYQNLKPSNINTISPKKTRSLNSLSGSMSVKHINKDKLYHLPETSIYSSPEIYKKLRQPKSNIFHSQTNPFYKMNLENGDRLSKQIADIISRSKIINESESKGKGYKQPLKLRLNDGDESQESFAFLNKNYLNKEYFPVTSTSSDSRVIGLSFVDRQERMISKYKANGIRLETDPHWRVDKLVSFNY